MVGLAQKQVFEQTRLTVGKRLFSARNLARMSQVDAARELGYQNSSALSKIEAGRLQWPQWLIPEASQLYGVSCDYIYGLSEYPERDPSAVEHAAVVRSVRAMMLSNAEQVAGALLKVQSIEGPAYMKLEALAKRILDLHEEFTVMRENNPVFDAEVRGGARVKATVDKVRELAVEAIRVVERRNATIQTIATHRIEAARLTADLDLF